MNPVKEDMAKVTNRKLLKGTLSEAIKGADVFLGMSVAGALKPEMVKTMAHDSIIFLLWLILSPRLCPMRLSQLGQEW